MRKLTVRKEIEVALIVLLGLLIFGLYIVLTLLGLSGISLALTTHNPTFFLISVAAAGMGYIVFPKNGVLKRTQREPVNPPAA